MAIINDSLLIAAPVLQDYLVDKDTGLPLAAGIITFFSETQRNILKPIYTQQGTNPPYSYVPLPNPLTLSAVGTIQDNSGNDVIPFFYPYTYNPNTDSYTNVFDAYYIVVTSSTLEEQFTRSNFPFVPTPSTVTAIDTNESLLVNSVFWRNVGTIALGPSNISGTISLNSIPYSFWTLAPGQHDGNIMPDITYFKNATDGTETISFPKFTSNFPDNILVGDITPEYYMNNDCTSIGTATARYLQIPINPHIDSLSGFVQDTFTLQAMSVDGLNETLTIGIFQFCGTGVTSPAVAVHTITLSPVWNKFEINLPIPTAQGVTVGQGGDDGLYIQIGFPTTGSFNVNIALPSFYLSDTASTNSYQTYDEVNAIASSPRTGDVRVSTNSFTPYGCTAMNDGVIALSTPTNLAISRINSDVWLIYNLLWNLAKPYDTGSNFNPICQLYTNAGVATNYGTSAYADFTASDSGGNRALALTKIMGRVLLGTVPLSSLQSLSPAIYKNGIISASSGANACVLITITSTANFWNGMPIVFQTTTGSTLPGNIVANQVYYVGGLNFSGANTFYISTTFSNSIKLTPLLTIVASISGLAVAFSSAGTGLNNVFSSPTGSMTGEYAHTQLSPELAAHVHPPSPPTTSYVMNFGGGGATSGSGGIVPGILNTGSAGNSVPFNVTQPGTFFNMFIKL